MVEVRCSGDRRKDAAVPQFPGELTPEEQEEWKGRLRRMAEERWGAGRTAEIGVDLDRTAIAVGSVLKLEFISDEPPGFYPGTTADSASSEWGMGGG